MITYYAPSIGYTNIIVYIFSFNSKPFWGIIPIYRDKTETEELGTLHFISSVCESCS